MCTDSILGFTIDRLDAKHVSPRLRGASGDVRRCRGEQHDRKRTVEFETTIEWSNMSGSATQSRLPLGAFDDALGHKQQLPQCLQLHQHRGARRPRGHALRCTSELLRRERSIGLIREFFSGERNRRLSTRQPMDGSDGSTRDAQVFLHFLYEPLGPALYELNTFS